MSKPTAQTDIEPVKVLAFKYVGPPLLGYVHPSMSELDICFVLGTRPEIIKLSPVIDECEHRNISFSLLHTGQHYTSELDQVFFDQLDVPVPDYNLDVGSETHGRQTGAMIGGIESILEDRQPDILTVQGDTNTVLAGGIAASKMADVDIAHVEAGLRSFDPEMPEEINRRLVDHVADYLFAPTDTAKENLRNENLAADTITVTGNTIVDAVHHYVELAHRRSDVLERLEVNDSFALLTAHREENVDDPDRFRSILDGVERVASEYDLQVIYPIHPRARKRIDEFALTVPPRITVIEPLDFLDFLVLEDEATVVLTDSGGVQEEACILGTPCLTLRDNTERPETVSVGANRIVGVSPDSIFEGTGEMLATERDWNNPFGDGSASKRIIDVLEAES